MLFLVTTTSLPAVDRWNADRWNAARSRQNVVQALIFNSVVETGEDPDFPVEGLFM